MTTTPVSEATKHLAAQLRQTEIVATADIHPSQRCDRCAVAQAQSRVTSSANGQMLYLCSHHLLENLEWLDADPNIVIHRRSGSHLK